MYPPPRDAEGLILQIPAFCYDNTDINITNDILLYL